MDEIKDTDDNTNNTNNTNASLVSKKRAQPNTQCEFVFPVNSVPPASTRHPLAASLSASNLPHLFGGLDIASRSPSASPDTRDTRDISDLGFPTGLLALEARVLTNRSLIFHSFQTPETAYVGHTILGLDELQQQLDYNVRPHQTYVDGGMPHHFISVVAPPMAGVKTCTIDFCRTRGIRLLIIHLKLEITLSTLKDMIEFAQVVAPCIILFDHCESLFDVQNPHNPLLAVGNHFFSLVEIEEQRYRASTRLCGTATWAPRHNMHAFKNVWFLFSLNHSPLHTAKCRDGSDGYIYLSCLRDRVDDNIVELVRPEKARTIAFMKELYRYHLNRRGVADHELSIFMTNVTIWEDIYNLFHTDLEHTQYMCPGVFVHVFECAFRKLTWNQHQRGEPWNRLLLPDFNTIRSKLCELKQNTRQ